MAATNQATSTWEFVSIMLHVGETILAKILITSYNVSSFPYIHMSTTPGLDSTAGFDPAEKDVQSQPAESGKIIRTIPGSEKRIEYFDGSFWLRLSPQDWKVAGITTNKARQLLGEDTFNSLIEELAEKDLPLPTVELVTGIMQTVRGLLIENGERQVGTKSNYSFANLFCSMRCNADLRLFISPKLPL